MARGAQASKPPAAPAEWVARARLALPELAGKVDKISEALNALIGQCRDDLVALAQRPAEGGGQPPKRQRRGAASKQVCCVGVFVWCLSRGKRGCQWANHHCHA